MSERTGWVGDPKDPQHPEIKTMAISNVYCRLMHFRKMGDFEIGHCHSYDHGTLVSSGKLLVELLRDDHSCISRKEFTAPGLIFITKYCKHRLIALEDDTIAVCIHALRDVEGNLLSPDFLVEEKRFASFWEDSDNLNDHFHLYMEVKRKVIVDQFPLTPKERDERFFKEYLKNKKKD